LGSGSGATNACAGGSVASGGFAAGGATLGSGAARVGGTAGGVAGARGGGGGGGPGRARGGGGRPGGGRARGAGGGGGRRGRARAGGRSGVRGATLGLRRCRGRRRAVAWPAGEPVEDVEVVPVGVGFGPTARGVGLAGGRFVGLAEQVEQGGAVLGGRAGEG